MKKILALLLALTLTLGAAALVHAEEKTPAGQYYSYGFSAEGYGDFVFYFHFYENDPVLGSVFYAGLSNNRINFAGLYTVEEAPYEYACYPDRDTVVGNGDKITGTAPYTIHFLNWNGEEFDRCGWDGETLYNDCQVITGSGSGPMFYHLDAEGKYQAKYDEEAGISYLNFVAVDDPTCTVGLNHNKTYSDMMVYFIDGSWAISDGENGAKVYTLTPFDETEDTVTLTVAADQKTAVYTDAEGTETEMVNAADQGPKAVYAGEGTFHVAAYNADATVTVTLYDDETCSLAAALYGNSAAIDQGTFTMNEDHSITFQFENAGEIVAKLDMSVMTVVLNYVNGETPLGAMKVALPIGRAEAEAPAKEAKPEPQVILSFEGSGTRLDVYDDGTYQFAYEKFGLKESGTWKFENYKFTIIQSNGNEIAASLDEAYNMSFEYVAEASDQLKVTYTAERSVWGSALAK